MEKRDVVEILCKRLKSVYCDTCVEKMETDICESCNRKSMNCGISKEYADYLAEKIIKNDKS